MSADNKYKIDEVEAAKLKEKVEALRTGITARAYHLVHIVMPQRVLEISDLYNVCLNNLSHLPLMLTKIEIHLLVTKLS